MGLLPLTIALTLPMITQQQSIQGFVYWDEDFNGILSEGILNPYGIYLRELENGVVNVHIEVNQCGSGKSVTKGLSGWLSDSIELPSSSSNIHSKAGYYKIDVGGMSDESGLSSCLMTDENLKSINGVDDEKSDGESTNTGCYLVISSPKDMEITTTFPLPYSHRFYVSGHGQGHMKSEELNSIVDDVFGWIPYKDMGPISYEEVTGDDVINRGYQTRTSECFGYNTDNKQWYVWKDLSLDTNEESSYDEEDAKAILVNIPNTKTYGYDRYLTLNSYNYDGVLSISPVGMAENMWPLPLRVKSDVFLGIKFDAKGPNGRFAYEITSEDQAVAASTYRPHHALRSEENSNASDSNIFSTDRTNASDGFVLDNVDGILSDFTNLEVVVQSFLKEKVLNPSRASGLEQMMISLNSVGFDQWSMVKIKDNRAPSSSNKRMMLRVSNKTATPVSILVAESTNSNLRANYASTHSHRQLIMHQPHQIFHFQVYGTYSSRATSDISSIIHTINDFGKTIEYGINGHRKVLIADIRKRTGLDLECTNPKNETTSGTLDEETYSVIDIGEDASKSLTCRDSLPLYYHDLSELESRGKANHNAALTEKDQLFTALNLLKKASQVNDVHSLEDVTDSSRGSFWIYFALSVLGGVSIAACGVVWVIYERKRRAMIRERKRLKRKERKARAMAQQAKKLTNTSRDLDGSAKYKSVSEMDNEIQVSENSLGMSNNRSSSHLEKSTRSSHAIENSSRSSADQSDPEETIHSKDVDSDSSDSELDRLFDESLKTKTTTDLEQSNLNLSEYVGSDHNASKSGLIYLSSRERKHSADHHDRQGEVQLDTSNHTKNMKSRSTRIRNGSNTFNAVMASIRQSTTDKILGKLVDSSDSDSSNSSEGSSDSDKEKEMKVQSRIGNRRRILTSAMKNVRSSVTKSPRSNGVRNTANKIRSSLTKRRAPPQVEDRSSSDDGSSLDSSSHSSGSSSSSASSTNLKNPSQKDLDRSTFSRRASGHRLVKREDSQPDAKGMPTHSHAQLLPEFGSLSETNNKLPRMQSDCPPKSHADKFQKHRTISRHLGSHKNHKKPPMRNNLASERKLDVSLHDLKPSKAKSSRNLHQRATKVHVSKSKSTRQLKSNPMKEDTNFSSQLPNPQEQLTDSVVSNKAVYLPEDLKQVDIQREHQLQLSLSRSNSERSMPQSSSAGGSRRKSRKSNSNASSRPDHPPQPLLHRRESGKKRTALAKLNELKSSLRSSFDGNKLSGAATSILNDADAPAARTRQKAQKSCNPKSAKDHKLQKKKKNKKKRDQQ